MEELQNSITKDINQGYTSYGAHKADVLFEIESLKGSKKASFVLSRGEMKLTVCAFKIAQAILFNKKTSRKCIFLLDDLPAELDKNNINKVIDSLITLDSQVFVTSIEAKEVTKNISRAVTAKVFVVKKGNVQLA
jgi:DNA replication and repair protein RecF